LGFLFLLPHPFSLALLLYITENTIPHPATMNRQNITVSLIENGYQVIGRREGDPMAGRGSGFQAIGDTALNSQRII
jgi:hypothetical protein